MPPLTHKKYNKHTFLFHALKIEFVTLYAALSVDKPFRIHVAEEPIHVELQHVDFLSEEKLICS